MTHKVHSTERKVIRAIQLLFYEFNDLLRKELKPSSMLDRFFFVNKDIVVMERNLFLPGEFPLPVKKGIRFVEITNSAEASKLIFPRGGHRLRTLKNVEDGYKGFALVRGNHVLGYVWFSNGENGHPDLRWMEVPLGEKEVYMFNPYVRPEERVGGTAFILLKNAYNALKNQGITKVYCCCPTDNLHLAVRWVYKTLGFKEISRFKLHLFFFVMGRSLRRMFIRPCLRLFYPK